MPSKLKRLNDAKTYVILDTQVLGYKELLRLLPKLVKAGVGIVQLRDKIGQAKGMLSFCQEAMAICQGKTLMIMNDRVDVAIVSGVDGVHVGQEDMPMGMVRQLVGKNMLVGVSCQTIDHARRAEEQGADYIGFGSIFKTLTKPERSPMSLKLLQNVHSSIKIPIFPIGGITLSNVKDVLSGGARRVAVCRDVILAPNPSDVVKKFSETLRN